jgi:hypothetical protein
MSIRFSAPPTKLANGEPAMHLDFGDGTTVSPVDGTGTIKHVYAAPPADTPHPWLFVATLTDADGAVRGSRRFELPHPQTAPWDLAAWHAPFAG